MAVSVAGLVVTQTIKTAPPGRFNDLIAVVLGLALYALFIGWAHVRLFAVSPLG